MLKEGRISLINRTDTNNFNVLILVVTVSTCAALIFFCSTPQQPNKRCTYFLGLAYAFREVEGSLYADRKTEDVDNGSGPLLRSVLTCCGSTYDEVDGITQRFQFHTTLSADVGGVIAVAISSTGI